MIRQSLHTFAIVSGRHARAQAVRIAHQAPTVPAAILERPIDLRAGADIGLSRARRDAIEDASVLRSGPRLSHGYAWIDAERSFRQALRSDGVLAMAHLGLSYTA
jgi:hypothetical protein